MCEKCVDCRPAKKLPNRLPKYPVPERLRKCIIENKDVTTAVACLLEVHLSYVLCLWFSSFIFSVLWPYILRCVKSLS